jgi:hypothetical protein
MTDTTETEELGGTDLVDESGVTDWTGEQRTVSARRSVPDGRPNIAAQHARFGGFKPGAAFFGWLVATGLGVLLAGIATAAGAGLRFSHITAVTDQADSNASTIGLAGGIVLIVIVVVSNLTGGYVAGRLARFDGMRQGLGVWIIGLVLTAAFGIAGWLLGTDYNVLNRINLPNVPISDGTLTRGGLAALAAATVGSLVAAIVGGKIGEHYHRRIDLAGYPAPASTTSE